MTSYGFVETVSENTQISVEFKSVNSRFLDLSVYLPPFLNPLEQKIRSLVSDKVTRGKIDLSLRVKDLSTNASVSADVKAAKMYFDAIKDVASVMGISSDKIPLSLIVSQPGVLNTIQEYDMDSYWKKIEPVFCKAFDQFLDGRVREGANLKKDLLLKLSVLDECADFFADWQPKMEAKFKETITAKFRELLADKADENRIMTETAAMLVKYTINEEIIRLKSHLKALRDEIESNPVPGKRIDFFCQEANREINTIGSKNQFTEVGAMVVKAKDALENIREQAKNVE